ncbi:Cytochrome c [Rubripirellula lacrimiformis]|uniref:Cytochrome c n=1 Tax=Rubripirellula lacrimiformis TaxID=1930273 RepID=A0A517NG31_9BACT|nr:c-type cytochrome [Rubripirellula lacrimiformis]QDT06090.1 Cytochrome c [Rubripirellula lacrimiformis]
MNMQRLTLTLMISLSALISAPAQQPDTSRAANDKVAEIIQTFAGRGVMADGSQPTPADVAVTKFRVVDGLQMELVAAEPDVSQPLFVSFDSRGRMWVVHYRQYQFPAGLKIVRYDQHLRAVFDRVPDPPPIGTPGADKITVHTDTDGDGRYDSQKDVITGLNIATSVAIGRGGIWVLNPPYLLFYPDADGDDVPDSAPEVHLSGFGLQDTHSVANSLRFGPDGWLYGANGSTTTCDVSSAVTKGVRFEGQCVWRYHPPTKVFEVFAEGGGNTFSLEIDSRGQVLTGTNGGNTRGWYFPQGSYSEKNWGKHGPLSNPYAFGFFPPMRFEGDGRRFPQAFSIYEGGLLPDQYAGTIIAPNSLHNLIWNSRLNRDGSTYRTEDLPNLVETDDRWFRPVHCEVGPDGSVYVADWYDTRLSHVSPIDDWHKESGRIYRIQPTDQAGKYDIGDLHAITVDKLIELFDHPNKWVRHRAVLELGWRNESAAIPTLIQRVDEGFLEGLWALAAMQQLTPDRASKWLAHSHPDIRRLTVRLLGDMHVGHPQLASMAESEDDVQVRSQLAATAKRLDAGAALPIIRALINHDEDIDDPHMPLMIWWALEAQAADRNAVAGFIEDDLLWQRPMFRNHLADRLIQRYASAAKPEDLSFCATYWQTAPDDAARAVLMRGLNAAFQGGSLPPLPDALAKAIADYQQQLGDSGLVLALRQGIPDASANAIKALLDPKTDLGIRMTIAETLGQVGDDTTSGALLRLATGQNGVTPALQRVAISALGRFEDVSIANALVQSFGSRISEEHGLRAAACRVLASRPNWAMVMLTELNQWRLRRDQVPTDVVQQLRSYQGPEIVAAVEQAFGPDIASTGAEAVAEMKRLRKILAEKPGNADAGKLHFQKKCGTCHQLFGDGLKVGPPLDGYSRGDIPFWLIAIIQPNLEIREGFQSYMVLTEDGRAINGMIAAADGQSVTIRNADNQMTTIPRDRIEDMQAIKTSLMPTGLLADMTDDQIRDLIAYVSQ